jgi:hypothetical protein
VGVARRPRGARPPVAWVACSWVTCALASLLQVRQAAGQDALSCMACRAAAVTASTDGQASYPSGSMGPYRVGIACGLTDYDGTQERVIYLSCRYFQAYPNDINS